MKVINHCRHLSSRVEGMYCSAHKRVTNDGHDKSRLRRGMAQIVSLGILESPRPNLRTVLQPTSPKYPRSIMRFLKIFWTAHWNSKWCCYTFGVTGILQGSYRITRWTKYGYWIWTHVISLGFLYCINCYDLFTYWYYLHYPSFIPMDERQCLRWAQIASMFTLSR